MSKRDYELIYHDHFSAYSIIIKGKNFDDALQVAKKTMEEDAETFGKKRIVLLREWYRG